VTEGVKAGPSHTSLLAHRAQNSVVEIVGIKDRSGLALEEKLAGTAAKRSQPVRDRERNRQVTPPVSRFERAHDQSPAPLAANPLADAHGRTVAMRVKVSSLERQELRAVEASRSKQREHRPVRGRHEIDHQLHRLESAAILAFDRRERARPILVLLDPRAVRQCRLARGIAPDQASRRAVARHAASGLNALWTAESESVPSRSASSRGGSVGERRRGRALLGRAGDDRWQPRLRAGRLATRAQRWRCPGSVRAPSCVGQADAPRHGLHGSRFGASSPRRYRESTGTPPVALGDIDAARGSTVAIRAQRCPGEDRPHLGILGDQRGPKLRESRRPELAAQTRGGRHAQ
jgi:hypothetical protein